MFIELNGQSYTVLTTIHFYLEFELFSEKPRIFKKVLYYLDF